MQDRAAKVTNELPSSYILFVKEGIMVSQLISKPASTLADLRASTSVTISRKEVAAALGVDPRTVTVGINDGTIPSLKLGRRVVIPREKFLALFEVNTNE